MRSMWSRTGIKYEFFGDVILQIGVSAGGTCENPMQKMQSDLDMCRLRCVWSKCISCFFVSLSAPTVHCLRALTSIGTICSRIVIVKVHSHGTLKMAVWPSMGVEFVLCSSSGSIWCSRRCFAQSCSYIAYVAMSIHITMTI